MQVVLGCLRRAERVLDGVILFIAVIYGVYSALQGVYWFSLGMKTMGFEHLLLSGLLLLVVQIARERGRLSSIK